MKKIEDKGITNHLVNFQEQGSVVLNLMTFMLKLARHKDESNVTQSMIMISLSDAVKRKNLTKWEGMKMEEDYSSYKKIVNEGGVGAFKELEKYQRIMLEMIFCRFVDSFLNYISNILAMVYKNKPETLCSKKQVDIEFVLGHQDMNELILSIAEKKINELSYESMEKINDNIKKELGITLFDKEDDLRLVTKINSIRNLIIHSSSKIDSLYLKRVMDCSQEKGDILTFETSEVLEWISFIDHQAKIIDQAFISKFSLPTT
jgi:hypothetical protein